MEIPLVWSIGTAAQVYAEVLQEIAQWIRGHGDAPPADLDARLFVAFSTLREAVLTSLVFPALAPPIEQLLPALVDSVHLALTSERLTSTPQFE